MKKIFTLFMALLLCFTFTGIALAESDVSLSVEVSPTELSAAGDVTLSITVTNNNAGAVSAAVLYVDGKAQEEIGNLAEYLSKSLTVTYSVPASKLGESIPVRIDYQYDGASYSEESSFKVGKKSATVSVATRVSVDQPKVTSGDSVTFTFVIENQGDVDITNAVLKASPLKNGNQIGETFSLTPGSSRRITYEVEVTTDVTVKPVLTYKASGSDYTSNFDSVSVRVNSGELELTLTAGNTSIATGETVPFTLTIENTGKVDLQDIVIKNPYGNPVSADRSTLSAGSSMTVNETLAVTATGKLTYSVSAKDKNGNVVSELSNAIEVVVANATATPAPSDGGKLTLAVVADTKTTPGKVIFAITVTNSGSEPITDIKIAEHTLGQVGSIANLVSAEKTLSFEADFMGSSPVTYTFEAEGKSTTGEARTASAVVTATPSGGESVPNSISTLLIIIIAIVVVIVGLGVALIIVLRKDKAKKAALAAGGAIPEKSHSAKRQPTATRTPRENRDASQTRAGITGKKAPKPVKKNYDDRNNL